MFKLHFVYQITIAKTTSDGEGSAQKLGEISENWRARADRARGKVPFENRFRGGAILHAAHTRCIPPHASHDMHGRDRPGRRRRRRPNAGGRPGFSARQSDGATGGDGENISEFD